MIEIILFTNVKTICMLKSFLSFNMRKDCDESIFIKRMFSITFWHSGKWRVTALHVEPSITRVAKKHVILKGGGRKGRGKKKILNTALLEVVHQ